MNSGIMPSKKVESFPTLFEDFFKPWREWFDGGLEKVSTIPSVNVSEANNHYKVMVAAPGLKKEDFKINVDGNLISISAEKSSSSEEKDEKYTRKEYSYTSFERTFTLPENVAADQIEARYENGELQLTIPKLVVKQTTTPKKIEVR
ncbi:MAG: Hsp20/alpha crystallin family protein [Lacibacter sp.]